MTPPPDVRRAHKRRYACHEGACAITTFVEQDDTVAAPRALLTARAVSWSLAQLRAELNRPALGDQPQGEAPPGYAQLGSSAVAQQPLARPSQS